MIFWKQPVYRFHEKGFELNRKKKWEGTFHEKEKKGIRIAICDDSSRDREFIKSVLNEYALGHRDIFLIEEFENGEELLEIQEDVFHLIFLDIYMNSLNGMDVARTLREKGIKSRIVFCSSSKDFAAESYEVDELYYLIKNGMSVL